MAVGSNSHTRLAGKVSRNPQQFPIWDFSKLLERPNVWAGACCIFFKKVEMGEAFSASFSKPSPKPLPTQTTYFSHSGIKQPGQDTSRQTPNYCLGLSIAEADEERQPPDLPLLPLCHPQPMPTVVTFSCIVEPRHVSCHRVACLYLKRLAAVCQ